MMLHNRLNIPVTEKFLYLSSYQVLTSDRQKYFYFKPNKIRYTKIDQQSITVIKMRINLFQIKSPLSRLQI